MDGLNFVNHLANYIGETVTIFTTSGGESGEGFTGVLLSVNNSFVRLITQIGTAPGCALGNCCKEYGQKRVNGVGPVGGVNDVDGQYQNPCEGTGNIGDTGRFTCRGNTVGSVADIPIDRIAAFVHNAV